MGHFGGAYDIAVGFCYLFLAILGENVNDQWTMQFDLILFVIISSILMILVLAFATFSFTYLVTSASQWQMKASILQIRIFGLIIMPFVWSEDCSV